MSFVRHALGSYATNATYSNTVYANPVLQCPSNLIAGNQVDYGPPITATSSESSKNLIATGGFRAGSYNECAKANQVKYSSQTPYFMEIADASSGQYRVCLRDSGNGFESNLYSIVHKDSSNVEFFDGHVQSVNHRKLYAPDSNWKAYFSIREPKPSWD